MSRFLRPLAVAAIAAALALGFVSTASASVTSFTVDDATISASKTEVTVSGTIVCTDGDTASVTAYIFQSSGKVDATAAAVGPDFVCTGTVQAWSVVLPVLIGTSLKPGPANWLAGASDSTDSTSIIDSGGIHLHK